jgi:tetratricopeptide (TPR) repeat protein
MAGDQLAGDYFYVALAARETGDLNLALESARKAASIRETIHTDVPAQRIAVQSHSAGDHAALALILRFKGDLNSALVEQRKAVAITAALSQENPYDATTRSFLGQGDFTLAQIFTQMGQATPALDALREAKGIFEPLLSFDPGNAFVKEHVALIYELSGRLQVNLGKPELGLEDLKKALAMLDEFRNRGAIPENMFLDLAITYDAVGQVYATVGGDSKAPAAVRINNLKQARQWYQKSMTTWSAMRGRGTLDPLDERDFEGTAKSLADCEAELKKLAAL